tara:strand:+ start:335 stop:688 length:354 start_codon:yes stop_codon:yes gene_type:complete
MVGIFNIYQQPGWVVLALLVIASWTLLWKGLGLWHAARGKQKIWFVVILIFNTMGLLPIIYLLWFKPGTKAVKPVANNRVTEKTVPKKTTKKVAKKKPVKKKTVKKAKLYPKPRKKK